MAGDTMKCPHCECKVKISDVEKEEGCCPECGLFVTASSLQKDIWDVDTLDDENDDLMDEFDDEYDHAEEEENLEDDMETDFGEEDLDDEAFFDEELKPKRSRAGMAMGSIGNASGSSSGSGRRKASTAAAAPAARKPAAASRSSRSSRKK